MTSRENSIETHELSHRPARLEVGEEIPVPLNRSGVRYLACLLVALLAVAAQAQIPEWQANRQVIDNQTHPAVARSPTGDLVMVWDSRLTDGDEQAVVMRRFSADGTPLDATQILVNGTTVGRQEKPRLAIDGSGEIVVVWEGRSTEDRFGVVGRRFGADGTALGPEFQVDSDVSGYQINPQVARAADGTFAVVWQEPQFDLYQFRRFAADGTPLEAPRDLGTGAAFSNRNSALAFDPNSDLLLVWRDEQIFVQRYSGGAAAGPIRGLAEDDRGVGQPAIAVAADGRYLVAWRSVAFEVRVEGQLLAADDSLMGSNVRFTSQIPPWLDDITAVAEDDGGFRVVWSAGSMDPAGVPFDLYSRRLDANGQLVGAGELRLTRSIDYDFVLPQLAPTPTGGSVLVWQKPDQDRQGIFTDMPTTQPLFVDGFESGGTSRWYLAVP